MDIKLQIETDPSTKHAVLQRIPQKLSFDKGFYVAVRAIQLMRRTFPDRVIICGVAGPSGAGKSSFARKISSVIPDIAIIALDNYLDATRKVLDQNFDDPRLVDFTLLVKNLRELAAGKPTQSPLYDFRKSGRYAYQTIHVPKSRVVIVEGTYALHESVRPLQNLRIAISGGVHFDLIKRILRDVHRTGQAAHESIKQITETVFPMYKAFIEPDLLSAHIRVVNQFDPFSGLLDPTFTIKSDKKVDKRLALEALGKSCKRSVESYYDIYLHPPGGSSQDYGKWIRVRNTRGKYQLTFSSDIKEGGFIISPRLNFVVSVKILGGLMALGYSVGAVINRKSEIFKTKQLGVSWDTLQQLGGKTYVQIKGQNRELVKQMAEKLGLTNFEDRSYIELYQERFAHQARGGEDNGAQAAALSSFVAKL